MIINVTDLTIEGFVFGLLLLKNGLGNLSFI
jgi:hypothetical protein